ncbi:hypothetical protein [Nannocystis pusilla]|uniref:hypothetical protein n=1 Tax=Nannocystis pusilla TaxID=889268 RepID=UPI003B7B6788
MMNKDMLKEMQAKARQNLVKAKEKLRRDGDAQRALHDLLQLVPDEPRGGYMFGLSPLVQRLAARKGWAIWLRQERLLAAREDLFVSGLTLLGSALCQAPDERRSFLEGAVQATVELGATMPDHLHPAEKLAAAAKRVAIGAIMSVAGTHFTGPVEDEDGQ